MNSTRAMTVSIARRHGVRLVNPKLCLALAATSIFGSGATSHADVVAEWNAIAGEVVATIDPAARARTIAIAQLAVFEAVNAIVGDFEPYLEKIDAPADASPEAAAVAAAHRVLVALLAESSGKLDAHRAASLAAIPDGAAEEHGIATGIAAADAILALRAGDGFDAEVPYSPGTSPGEWQPTPPDFTPAYRPGLGLIAPFGMKRGSQFRVPRPPSLRSHKYARDHQEVMAVGAAESAERPQDRVDVARFFAAADTEQTHHPAARQLSAAQGKTLSENARLFALLAMAGFDSAVACFESKYFYNTWRPIAAIREGDADGNRRTEADPEWTSLIDAPPFPGYPAGSSALDGAARVILEHFFGDCGFSVTLTHPDVPGVTLHYTNWDQLSGDVDDARVDGGVHFRFDQEAGFRLGQRVGRYLLRHELRSARGRDCSKENGRRGHETPDGDGGIQP
ncbi:MAG: vanadium-dependent haloperoxidase [Opitutaceae bacterium]